MLPFWATMLKQRSTLSKGRNFNATLVRHCCFFGNKVERCFDIVAGVGGALGRHLFYFRRAQAFFGLFLLSFLHGAM